MCQYISISIKESVCLYVYVHVYVRLSTLSRPKQWINLNDAWHGKGSTPRTLHGHPIFGKKRPKKGPNPAIQVFFIVVENFAFILLCYTENCVKVWTGKLETCTAWASTIYRVWKNMVSSR